MCDFSDFWRGPLVRLFFWIFFLIAVLFTFPERANAQATCQKSQTSNVVKQNNNGHFVAFALVNNNCVPFVVDTGASIVLLKYRDAVTAGISVERLRFKTPILTASGRSLVAKVDLDVLSLGDVQINRVTAAVAKPNVLPHSLLGMSFFKRIQEAVIRKGTITFKG